MSRAESSQCVCVSPATTSIFLFVTDILPPPPPFRVHSTLLCISFLRLVYKSISTTHNDAGIVCVGVVGVYVECTCIESHHPFDERTMRRKLLCDDIVFCCDIVYVCPMCAMYTQHVLLNPVFCTNRLKYDALLVSVCVCVCVCMYVCVCACVMTINRLFWLLHRMRFPNKTNAPCVK